MVKKPSLIEINGQFYDANSGRLFHHPRGPVIDGFVRKSHPNRPIKKVVATFSSVSHKPAKSRGHKPANFVHSRTQHSKTLMRSVVNRPHSHEEVTANQRQLKARTAAPGKARLSRAMNVVKNARVNRFGTAFNPHKPTLLSAIGHTKSPLKGTLSPQAKSATTAAVALRPPSMITSMSHQKLERMLDEALIHADAHKKALRNRMNGKSRLGRRLNFLPKWLTISLVALIVVSVGSYFAWSKIPYVSMKVASLRSQVQGSLPDYVPSGFKFAGTQYHPGNISMVYKAEGEKYFTLEQQASNWDSASLEANALPEDKQVQTSQVKGTTVFVDSSNNEATWVSDGKRYKLKGELNTDEIFKIADSIL